MGYYINVGNAGFQSSRKSEYIDKSDLISVVKSTLLTERRFSCVSRCRRFIIDEWDAICRERLRVGEQSSGMFPAGSEAMGRYVSWLRRMFKTAEAVRVFAGVYMTGILPVKKYKTESEMLADKHHADFDELEKWYDGYQIGDEPSVFNPDSVMSALRSRRCHSFWASTGIYDAVAGYIQMRSTLVALLAKNYERLKNDIVQMLAGGRCFVDPTGFQNDMLVIHSRDDVLTVLIHLVAQYADNLLLVGVNYDRETEQHDCRIEKDVAKYF